MRLKTGYHTYYQGIFGQVELFEPFVRCACPSRMCQAGVLVKAEINTAPDQTDAILGKQSVAKSGRDICRRHSDKMRRNPGGDPFSKEITPAYQQWWYG